MTFKHTSFYDSPVMRELARQENAKNPVVKTASEVKDPLAPSNDLVSDINKLAEGLRANGFKKEAQELELNLINYKIAETHLYKVFDEDAEDLIDFAHPGKNPNMDEYGSADGIVEDIFEQHKKILEVVMRDPKIKTAQQSDDDKIKAIVSGLTLTKSDITNPETLKKNIDKIKAQLSSLTSALASLSKKYAVSKESGDFFEAEKLYSLIRANKSMTDELSRQLTIHADRYKQLSVGAEKRLYDATESDYDSAVSNIVDAGGKMISNNEWQTIKSLALNKIKTILGVLKNSEISSDVIRDFVLTYNFLDKASNYVSAVHSFPESTKFYKSIFSLNDMLVKWEASLHKLKKKANVKEAQLNIDSYLDPKAVSTPAVAPKTVQTSAPQTATSQTAKVPAQRSALSDTEYQAVVTMQRSLNSLVETFKAKNISMSKEDETALLLTGFGSGTDQRQGQSVDGRWGPNTTRALQTAQRILKAIGVDSDFQTQGAYSDGKRVSSQAVTTAALSNVEKLNSAIRSIGGVTTSSDIEILDPELKLTATDLTSLSTLFDKLSAYPNFAPEGNDIIGWSRKKWIEVLNYLRARAAELKNVTYQKAVAGLFVRFRNLPKSAFVDAAGNPIEILSSKRLDSLLLEPTPVTLEEKAEDKATKYEQAAHTGVTERSDSEGRDSAKFNNTLPMPFDTTVNVKNLEVNYGNVAKNIDKYKSSIHFLTYRQLYNNPSALIRDLRPNVAWNEALYYSNLSASGQAVIQGKALRNESGRAITWGQLESYQQADVRVVVEALKSKAAVIMVSSMLQGLQSDMIAAKNAYIETGIDNKTIAKREMVDMEKFYDLWSSAFDAGSRNLNSYLKTIKL